MVLVTRRYLVILGGMEDRLELQKSSEPTRVVWIDRGLVRCSPAMNRLLASIEDLRRENFQIEGWTEHIDNDLPLKARVAPLTGLPRSLDIYWFCLWGQFQYLRERIFRPNCSENTIYHGTMYSLPQADVITCNFHQGLCLKAICRAPMGEWRDWLRLLQKVALLPLEYLLMHFPKQRVFLVNSRSLGKAIEGRTASGTKIVITPNRVDLRRFNPTIREQYRETMRSKLRLKDDTKVFVFASQGHFHRKGFWLLTQALEEMANEGVQFTLLVVGGSEKSIQLVRGVLKRRHPLLANRVMFSGFQKDIRPWFSAADAFVFPSYFETYGQVALEALALGLPIFVTPYFGSEMYLKDGVNGRLLKYDVDDIAERLTEFVQEGPGKYVVELGDFLDHEGYVRHIVGVYNDVHSAKHRKNN